MHFFIASLRIPNWNFFSWSNIFLINTCHVSRSWCRELFCLLEIYVWTDLTTSSNTTSFSIFQNSIAHQHLKVQNSVDVHIAPILFIALMKYGCLLFSWWPSSSSDTELIRRLYMLRFPFEVDRITAASSAQQNHAVVTSFSLW